MPTPNLPDRVSLAELLRAAAFLIENPDKWEEFKQRFSLATCQAAVGFAEKSGLPPELVVKLKRDLGID